MHAVLGRRRHSSNTSCLPHGATHFRGRTALPIIRSLRLCSSVRQFGQRGSVQAQRRVVAVLHSRPLRLRVEQCPGNKGSPPPPPPRTNVPEFDGGVSAAPSATCLLDGDAARPEEVLVRGGVDEPRVRVAVHERVDLQLRLVERVLRYVRSLIGGGGFRPQK